MSALGPAAGCRAASPGPPSPPEVNTRVRDTTPTAAVLSRAHTHTARRHTYPRSHTHTRIPSVYIHARAHSHIWHTHSHTSMHTFPHSCVHTHDHTRTLNTCQCTFSCTHKYICFQEMLCKSLPRSPLTVTEVSKCSVNYQFSLKRPGLSDRGGGPSRQGPAGGCPLCHHSVTSWGACV